MFEQMLLPTGGTHQIRNTALAVVLQALAVGFVVFAIPLIFVAQLPKLEIATELIAPPLPPPAPPPAPPAEATRVPATAQVAPRSFVLPRAALTAPLPAEAPMIAAAPPALSTAGIVGGIPAGIPDSVLNGTLGGSIGAPPAAKAQPAPQQAAVASAPMTSSPIRVGGEVEAAKLTHEVQPAYPPIARMARVSGMVRLSATIASNGAVKDLRVLSGSPLLVDSAVSAVKQWTYRPTYLNGKPVEVLTDIDVKFSLG